MIRVCTTDFACKTQLLMRTLSNLFACILVLLLSHKILGIYFWHQHPVEATYDNWIFLLLLSCLSDFSSLLLLCMIFLLIIVIESRQNVIDTWFCPCCNAKFLLSLSNWTPWVCWWVAVLLQLSWPKPWHTPQLHHCPIGHCKHKPTSFQANLQDTVLRLSHKYWRYGQSKHGKWVCQEGKSQCTLLSSKPLYSRNHCLTDSGKDHNSTGSVASIKT